MLLAIKNAVIQGHRVQFYFLHGSSGPETEDINRIRVKIDASLDGTYIEFSNHPTEPTTIFVRTFAEETAWEDKLAEAKKKTCPRDVMLR